MEGAEAVPVAELLEERRYLLDVAYWMVGGAGEAAGVVDETYRRWYGLSEAAREGIAVPRSWLAKTAGGICLGRLAVPGRGEDASGPAGPAGRAGVAEPSGVAGDSRAAAGLPAVGRTAAPRAKDAGTEAAENTEAAAVSRGLLTVLDSLSPTERAAFVLNDVFGLAPGAVADIVGRSEPETAELADRARHTLRVRRSAPTTPQEHDRLVHAVREACEAQDADLLASLLSEDATAFFDGGGKVRALTRPVHGSRPVAHSLLTLLAHRPHTTVATHSVNGRTGLVARYHHQVAAVISLDIADHRITQVWTVLNPDKLRLWNQPSPHDAHPATS